MSKDFVSTLNGRLMNSILPLTSPVWHAEDALDAEKTQMLRQACQQLIKMLSKIAWRLLLVAILMAAPPVFAREGVTAAPLVVRTVTGKSVSGVAVWLESSLKRVFLITPPGSTNLSYGRRIPG